MMPLGTGCEVITKSKMRVDNQYKTKRDSHDVFMIPFHHPKYHGIIRAASHLCLDCFPHKCINNCMVLTAPLSHTRRLHYLNPQLKMSWDYPCGFPFLFWCAPTRVHPKLHGSYRSTWGSLRWDTASFFVWFHADASCLMLSRADLCWCVLMCSVCTLFVLVTQRPIVLCVYVVLS